MNDEHTPNPNSPPGQNRQTVPGEQAVDDARSQALSESLRSSFLIVKIIVVVLIAVFLASLIFTVPSQQRAVVLRLGEPGQVLNPGYHWRLPFIDEVVRIPVGEVQSVTSTVGWYARGPQGQALPPGPSLDPVSDGYTLTADGNIIHVEATLRYRITDPIQYAFQFKDGTEVLQDFLNNALFAVSARYTVEDALWRNVTGFKEDVIQRVDQLVRANNLGVSLETSDLTTEAPRQVAAMFTQVQQAAQNRDRQISEAQGYASNILAKVRGEANQVLNQARAQQQSYVQQVASEAEYFQQMLPKFKQQPELLASRLQIETLQNVLTNAKSKFLMIERRDDKPRELRIQLNRLPEEQRQQGEQGSDSGGSGRQ